jgi:hypothetical protein
MLVGPIVSIKAGPNQVVKRNVVIERTRSEPPTTITHENTARERPN